MTVNNNLEAFELANPPLRLHELNIEGFVNDYLVANGWKSCKSVFRELHDKQKEVINRPERFKVLMWGRRCGKTFTAALLATVVALQPSRTIWIVSHEFDQTDRVFDEVWNILIKLMRVKTIRQSRKGRVIELENGSKIVCKSIKSEKALDGDSIDLCIWDEAAKTPNGDIYWQKNIRPSLADRKGSAIFISTPEGSNWFYEFFKRGKLPKGTKNGAYDDWWGSHATSYHNKYVDPSEHDKARMELEPSIFAQQYLADPKALVNRIFGMFDEKLHVIENSFRKENGPIWTFMDFNTATPYTILLVQYNQYTDTFYIIDEHCVKDKTAFDQGLYAIKMLWEYKRKGAIIQTDMFGNPVCIADIAGDQKGDAVITKFEMLRQAGFYVDGYKQKIEPGINLIQLYLMKPMFDQFGQPILYKDEKGHYRHKKEPKIFIDAKCITTIIAFETAQREVNQKTKVEKEVYEKDGKTDGPLDAFRYGIMYIKDDGNTVENISVDYHF